MTPYEARRIAGLPGYWADTDGRILSSKAQLRGAAGWHDSGLPARELAIRLSRRRSGYRIAVVDLWVDGRPRTVQVASLVLTAFAGPKPSPSHEACHWPDRDPANNRPDNLRWGTRAENYADAMAHGTAAVGTRNGAAKLDPARVQQIRALLLAGVGLRALGRRFGVSKGCVRSIRDMKTWAHV